MYDSFELLKKISFVRTGGSAEELKAAEMIKEEVEKHGVSATIEPFPVDGYTINKAELSFSDPDMTVPFVGVGISGSTPEGGVDGELVFIPTVTHAEMMDVKGKICVVYSKSVDHAIYKKLVEKEAAAIILCTGDVYSDSEDIDLDPYRYRERNYSLGKIPAVCIKMTDAEEITKIAPKRAHIELQQDEYKVDSRNVVAEIKGTEHPEEVIIFSAHFDSVAYSKGAWDNGSGACGIMELLAYFSEHKPSRTLRFVWCGSEEDGLLGSKAYVEAHKDELDKCVLNINIDMIGVAMGSTGGFVTADQKLVGYLEILSKINNFPLNVRQGVMSSDSSVFADNGVPAMSFGSMSVRGGATFHSRKDVIERLSEEYYYQTCEFIEIFADSLVNAKVFPVAKEIPMNMKEELDYYFARKERPAGAGFRF